MLRIFKNTKYVYELIDMLYIILNPIQMLLHSVFVLYILHSPLSLYLFLLLPLSMSCIYNL